MQIIGFLILLLIFIAILSVDKERLDSKQKGMVIAFLITIVALGAMYEHFVSENTESKRAMVLRFTQGGTLTCKGIEVNKERFNYENGTASFLPKDGFPQIRGTVISIDDCEALNQ